ncbi:hypothetical protein ACIOD1_12695 [Streptomyces sp. NPDC088097]|uniref:hypothetical protein n=1 Tax=Streptomyces sp. NPDC088097 TaxID=3365823 RepID=UPI0037F94698
MDQAGSATRARIAAAGAGAAMTFSTGILAYGIVDSSIPASVGGGLAGLAAAGMMGLAKLRAWTVDTSAERRQLADSVRQAQNEETRYVAAQGAQAEEHRRRLRDIEGDRVRQEQHFIAAKAAMEADFEARREALIIESMATGIRLHLAGLLNAPTEAVEAKILRLPGQQQPVRERATAHPADQAPEAVRDRGVARP